MTHHVLAVGEESFRLVQMSQGRDHRVASIEKEACTEFGCGRFLKALSLTGSLMQRWVAK